jgi:hypothetical protein
MSLFLVAAAVAVASVAAQTGCASGSCAQCISNKGRMDALNFILTQSSTPGRACSDFMWAGQHWCSGGVSPEGLADCMSLQCADCARFVRFLFLFSNKLLFFFFMPLIARSIVPANRATDSATYPATYSNTYTIANTVADTRANAATDASTDAAANAVSDAVDAVSNALYNAEHGANYNCDRNGANLNAVSWQRAVVERRVAASGRFELG